jgi:hypothetical protein
MAMSEEAFLKYMAGKARELKKAPGPTSGQKPKVTRMMSPRQAAATKGSPNAFRASYSPRTYCVTGEPENPTREVGPGDKYNRTNDYTMGKDTVNRNPKGIES